MIKSIDARYLKVSRMYLEFIMSNLHIDKKKSAQK